MVADLSRVSIPLYPLPPEYDDAGRNWKRPGKRETGDTTDDVLYRSVVLTLSRWELVENFMARLFAILVSSPSQAAARAFGTVTSSSGRSEMLRRAGEVYFDHPAVFYRRKHHDAGVLNKLLKNYEVAAQRRNDIAHGIAAEITWTTVQTLGWLLVPPDYNTRRTKLPSFNPLGEPQFGIMANFRVTWTRTYLSRAAYAYASDDILTFARKFEELSLLTARFVHNLRAIEEHGDQQ